MRASLARPARPYRCPLARAQAPAWPARAHWKRRARREERSLPRGRRRCGRPSPAQSGQGCQGSRCVAKPAVVRRTLCGMEGSGVLSAYPFCPARLGPVACHRLALHCDVLQPQCDILQHRAAARTVTREVRWSSRADQRGWQCRPQCTTQPSLLRSNPSRARCRTELR